MARAVLKNQEWFSSHQLSQDRNQYLWHSDYYWSTREEKSQLIQNPLNYSNKRADITLASFRRTPKSTANISNSNPHFYTCALIPLIFKVFMNTLKMFSVLQRHLNSCSATKHMFST